MKAAHQVWLLFERNSITKKHFRLRCYHEKQKGFNQTNVKDSGMERKKKKKQAEISLTKNGQKTLNNFLLKREIKNGV